MKAPSSISTATEETKSHFLHAQWLVPKILGNPNQASKDIQDPEVQAFAVDLLLSKLE